MDSTDFSMSHPTPNLLGAEVLIGTHNIITQTMLNSVTPARAADLHGFSGITKERSFTLLVIGKLVAEFGKICNFTPVVVKLNDVEKGIVNETDFAGTIIPFVVPKVVMKNCCPLAKTHASMSLTVYQYFNFVYCDIDRDRNSNLGILLLPFEVSCWLFIALFVFLVPLLLTTKMPKRYFDLLFVTFASLLSQEISVTRRNRSILLILWVFGTMVLNTLYSGVLTSFVISPGEKDVIRTVDELSGRNYRLLYADSGFFKYVSSMVQQLLSVDESMGNNKTMSDKTSLELLVQSIQFDSSLPAMIESLAMGSGSSALFGPFLLVMEYWFILTKKIDSYSGSSKTRRSCHLGKSLSSKYAHPEVWIFKEGNLVSSAELARVFNRLHANGIHEFWMDVFERIQGSPRAQDLNKFKTSTDIKVEIPVEPLGFHNGSTAVVFLLGAMGVMISFAAFLIEIFWNLLRNRVTLDNDQSSYLQPDI